jgi:hypothetical protein
MASTCRIPTSAAQQYNLWGDLLLLATEDPKERLRGRVQPICGFDVLSQLAENLFSSWIKPQAAFSAHIHRIVIVDHFPSDIRPELDHREPCTVGIHHFSKI